MYELITLKHGRVGRESSLARARAWLRARNAGGAAWVLDPARGVQLHCKVRRNRATWWEVFA